MILCGLVGAVLLVIGAVLGWGQYLMIYVLIIIRQNIPLIDGTVNYQAWSSPINLLFSCYLFNVTNPDDVMRGDKPNFVECGPFTYDVLLEKEIIDVDEETDEITYMAKSTYTFNKYKSLNLSRSDKVTILNPAYIGTILTLATLPAQLMEKYGDDIPKLFTNRSSIFLKARPVDILFNGVKVSCNVNKFPELKLICKTLAAKPPPVLRATEKEGVYFLSIFQRINATLSGPFSTNRGLKNLTQLGDTTSFKGKRVQTFWSSESCNKIRGTDTITWAPLVEPLPSVSTFIPELCRSIDADYELDLSINGLIGSRYVMKERVWFLNETECYCAVVQKKKECLPQGLIDVAECQVTLY
ncbi:sensory neuron membrane protein 2 [Andrena cerasifolii]|uniref:sensory neuron membrane protein 2 n=1 Tax=Andrena cerasifolii TaxID=2819439 RepID=UPI004037A6E8